MPGWMTASLTDTMSCLYIPYWSGKAIVVLSSISNNDSDTGNVPNKSTTNFFLLIVGMILVSFKTF